MSRFDLVMTFGLLVFIAGVAEDAGLLPAARTGRIKKPEFLSTPSPSPTATPASRPTPTPSKEDDGEVVLASIVIYRG